MACQVAEHLVCGRHLCIEAPTGIGKTFAYLVPAIRFAAETGLPVVISTHTISLQEQIVDKDLPLLQKLMGTDCDMAIAKGRANYVCLRRLSTALSRHQDFLPGAGLQSGLERLRLWAEATEDGSLADLPREPSPAVWDTVCCEIGNCMNVKCPHFRHCFLMQARRRLAQAQIIVANHALFFTDLAMKQAARVHGLDANGVEGGVLPAYGAVILDEGHTVEDSAATNMGLRLTAFSLKRILERLYSSEHNRGLLVDERYVDARSAVVAAAEKTQRFFAALRDWLEQQEQNPLRYTAPGHISNALAIPLEQLEAEVGRVMETETDDDRRTELQALRGQIYAYRTELHHFLEMSLAEHVYWFERQGPGLRRVALNAVPIEVGRLLRERLFAQNFSVVVTSATLAVHGSMEYCQKRLGAEETDSAVLTSPFDFERQVKLYLPQHMPNPKDTDEFVPAACEHIRTFLLKTEGKAFVLFTSYKMMYEAAEILEDFFQQSDLRLFVQGDGMQRSRMLQAFREDINSVIFGTASFWTGVDVPGQALSNVIIVKLPFAVPDHPLVAAREEMIESRGGRAFWEYSLPEAALKFRQGFGRLIRSREDEGIIVVLDNRIVRSSYGKVFLASIPECRREFF